MQPSADEAGAEQENHFPVEQQRGYLSHCRKGLCQTPLPGGRALGMFVRVSPVLGWLFFMHQVL